LYKQREEEVLRANAVSQSREGEGNRGIRETEGGQTSQAGKIRGFICQGTNPENRAA